MTQRLEAFIGFCVILTACFFGFLLVQANSGFSTDYYPVKVHFSDISGIKTGADVKMSGVKIGTVKQANLNVTDYRAELVLAIQENIKLPSDSTVKIASDGLLGGASVQIIAGFEEDYIKPNDELTNTQSAVSIMDLIAKTVFSAGTK
jgi:phospholipid/cholesterol/gamma-HCH transport system substrate-binding protein